MGHWDHFLLEDYQVGEASIYLKHLPNKVRDVLGILVDVNLYNEKGKDWISIEVDSHPYPVSYKGQYHYRSGSTKQELKGVALDSFLLKKQGRKWDGVPLPNVSVADLSDNAFEYFKRKATEAKRLLPDVLEQDKKTLIEKLRLIEGNYLKRAAILLFHPDPEKYFTGAFVKIGYFRTEENLLYQDDIHGNLFEQVEKTLDLLLSKYLKAFIRYEGLYRVEEYLYPESALREALMNAIAHKDYCSGNPIQIRVYEDRIAFWNAGELPDRWTVENLLKEHPSIPFNPDIATTFFRAGLIEAWGRGTLRILDDCKKAGLPDPKFSYEHPGFWIEFRKPDEKSSGKSSVKSSGKSSMKIMELMKENDLITIPEIASGLGLTPRAVEKQIAKLKKEKKVERVGPAKGGHWEVND